jgi:hypothetical protein
VEAVLQRLADRRRHRVLLRARWSELPAHLVGQHQLPVRPGRGLAAPTAGRVASTTTTRSRSATARTTGSPSTSGGPR